MDSAKQKSIIKSDPAHCIEKVAEKVIIRTNQYKVVGFVHVLPGSRLLDMLDAPSEFLPLTDVTVFMGDQELDQCKFAVVPKRAINLLMEVGGTYDPMLPFEWRKKVE
jgi:hypothetical protein